AQEYLFAVNVPTTVPDRKTSESDLTRTDGVKLKAAYPGWDFQVVKELKEVQHGGTGSNTDLGNEEGKKPVPIGPWVAHILLLAVMVLLFAEIVLACMFGHYTASATALGQAASRLRWLPGMLGSGLALMGLVAFVFLSVALVE